MDDKCKNNFLKKTQLFSSLSDEEMNHIIDKMVVKQFKKSETILYEEDTNEYM